MSLNVESTVPFSGQMPSQPTESTSKTVKSGGHEYTSNPLQGTTTTPSETKARMKGALNNILRSVKQIQTQTTTTTTTTPLNATHTVKVPWKENEAIHAKILRLEKDLKRKEGASNIMTTGLEEIRKQHSSHLSSTFQQETTAVLARHRSELMETSLGKEILLLRAASHPDASLSALYDAFGEKDTLALLKLITPETALADIAAIEKALHILTSISTRTGEIKAIAQGALNKIDDFNLNTKEKQVVKDGLSTINQANFTPTNPAFRSAVNTLHVASRGNMGDTMSRAKKEIGSNSSPVAQAIITIKAYEDLVEKCGEKALLEFLRPFAEKEHSVENIDGIEAALEINQRVDANANDIKENAGLQPPLEGIFVQSKQQKGFETKLEGSEAKLEQGVKLASMNELTKLNQNFIDEHQKMHIVLTEKQAQYKLK